jgi:DNA-directed RNA polymerase subunit RPC12/RpoP
MTREEREGLRRLVVQREREIVIERQRRTLRAVEDAEKRHRLREWKRSRYKCGRCGAEADYSSAVKRIQAGLEPRCRKCWRKDNKKLQASKRKNPLDARCSFCGVEITLEGWKKARKAGRPPGCRSCGHAHYWERRRAA